MSHISMQSLRKLYESVKPIIRRISSGHQSFTPIFSLAIHFQFFPKNSNTVLYPLMYSLLTRSSLRSLRAAIQPWIWSLKVSTCLGTLRFCSNSLTLSSGSSLEASMISGTLMPLASSGSTMAGWHSAATEKGLVSALAVVSETTLPPQQNCFRESQLRAVLSVVGTFAKENLHR